MYVFLVVKAMVVQPFVIIYSYVGICMVLAQRYEKFFSIDIIQNTHTQGLAQRANNYVYQVLVPRQLGTAPIYQRYEITLLLHTKISYFQGQVNATQKSHTHNVPVTNLNYGQSFFMFSVTVRQQLQKINFLVVSKVHVF